MLTTKISVEIRKEDITIINYQQEKVVCGDRRC
jgi:hypothetical protein